MSPRYGRVHLTLAAVLPDGDDPDALPERMPLNGSAVIRPVLAPGGAEIGLGPTGVDEIQVPTPTPCSVINGVLTRSGFPHVTLLVPTDGWWWEITFSDLAVEEVPIVLEPFAFPVAEVAPSLLADANHLGTNIAPFASQAWVSPSAPAAVGDAVSQMLLILVSAESAATGSAGSATAAGTAATSASSSATAAATSATNAGTAATAANTSASNAASSATAAATSATNASTSASAASSSASNAATARTNAQTAETNAETAETNAGNSAAAAATSATNASTARTGAETARTGAETAKTAAETARDVAIANGLTWRGPWAAGTAYVARNVVTHGGSSWRAIASSTGVTPVEGASWTMLAAKGDPGAGASYPALEQAAAETGTATDASTVSAAILKAAIQHRVTGSAATPVTTIGQNLAKAADALAARNAIGAGTGSAAVGFGNVVATHITGVFTTLDLAVAGLYRIQGGTGYVTDMPLTTAGLWWNVVLVDTADAAGANTKLYLAHSATTNTLYYRLKYGSTWGAWATVSTAAALTLLTQAVVETGTATTSQSISAAVLKGAIQKWVTGDYAVPVTAIGQNLTKAADAAAARTALDVDQKDWTGSQAAYDALGTYDANRTYWIV